MITALEAEEKLEHFYRTVNETIGFRLLTVLVWEPESRTLLRVFSSDHAFNPIGARKSSEVDTAWLAQCIQRQEVFFGPDRTAIRKAFTDWQAIEEFGCGTVINVPLVDENETAAVINALDAEGRYTPETADDLRALTAEHQRDLLLNLRIITHKVLEGLQP